jgi:hypothetical protein
MTKMHCTPDPSLNMPKARAIYRTRSIRLWTDRSIRLWTDRSSLACTGVGIYSCAPDLGWILPEARAWWWINPGFLFVVHRTSHGLEVYDDDDDGWSECIANKSLEG